MAATQIVHGCDHGNPARFRSAGAIASYVGVAPRLRQSEKKRFFSGSPNHPVGQRSPAQGALDGGSQCRATQSVAAPVLRTPSRRGQIWQAGRRRCYHAKVR
jgi:hypothetical protein